MKKYILIFLGLYLTVSLSACKNHDERKEELISPAYATVVSSYQSREKVGYQRIKKSQILFGEEGETEEYLLEERVYDSPDTDIPVERHGYYYIEPDKALKTTSMDWDWEATEDIEKDEYHKLIDFYLQIFDKMEKVEGEENEPTIYQLSDDAKKLAENYEFLSKFADSEKIDIRFEVEDMGDKKYISRLKLESFSHDLTDIIEEYFVMDIDKQKSIQYPKSFAKVLIKHNIKFEQGDKN